MSKYINTGGLWINKDKNGEEYFSGSFDADGKLIKIKVMKNSFKKPGDRSPDYRIMLDDSDPKPKSYSKPLVIRDDNSDIPF